MKKKVFLLVAIIMLISSCGDQTKMITIDNTKKITLHTEEIYKLANGKFVELTYDVKWDVGVSINGVDFGVVEFGQKSEPMSVPDAHTLNIKVTPVIDEYGLSIYHSGGSLLRSAYGGQKFYTSLDSLDVKHKHEYVKNQHEVIKNISKKNEGIALLNEEGLIDVSLGGNMKIYVPEEKAKVTSTTTKK